MTGQPSGSQRFLEQLEGVPLLEKAPTQLLQAPGMWQKRGSHPQDLT